MTSEALRDVMAASPFQPFRMHMGGGRQVDIRHPEFAWMIPSGRIVFVYQPGRDSAEIIDVFMIQSIELSPRDEAQNGERGQAA